MTNNRDVQELLDITVQFAETLHAAMVFYIALLDALLEIHAGEEGMSVESIKSPIRSFYNSFSLAGDLLNDRTKRYSSFDRLRKKGKLGDLRFDF